MHKDCAIIFVFFVFIQFSFFLTTVMHIISVTDFPLFCSNSTRKRPILPAECSPQKSLILLEILPGEYIQAYRSDALTTELLVDRWRARSYLLSVRSDTRPAYCQDKQMSKANVENTWVSLSGICQAALRNRSLTCVSSVPNLLLL